MTTSIRDQVESTIAAFLVRANKHVEVAPELLLFADGIGLDSLETAELSAMLEDEFGTDPFSEGLLPETIGEVVAFYDRDRQPQA